MKLKHWILRLLGVVSPSGAYPLPPRWALSKKGKERWYPHVQSRDGQLYWAANVVASGPGSVAAGGSIGSVTTGQPWATDVAAGPVPRGALTRFSTGDPQHTHGGTSAGVCGPGGDAGASCFDRTPYVPEADREPASRTVPRAADAVTGWCDRHDGGSGACAC